MTTRGSYLILAELPATLPAAWQRDAVQAFSASERHRLETIRRPHRRDQYIAGHDVLRRAALHWYGTAQVEVIGPRATLAGDHAPRVSLAHSGRRVAVLLADAGARGVGVDIEAPRTLRDPAALLAWVGAPVPKGAGEPGADEPGADLQTEALKRWTLFEARFKAGAEGAPTGWFATIDHHAVAVAGLDQPPDSFDFDVVTATYNPRRVEWRREH